MGPVTQRDDSDQREDRARRRSNWPIRRTSLDDEVREERVVMSRVLRSGEKDDGAFDLKFWQAVGGEGIFAAAWEMIDELRSFRGEDGDQPRLQRSVLRVVRRGR